METSNDLLRTQFSERLRAEFIRLELPLASPTQIARTFNQRFPSLAVTPQTVRKWLLAEAMPSQSKLLALAAWLGVSAQWLRFGTGRREDFCAGPTSTMFVLGAEYTALLPLIDLLARLPGEDLKLVGDLVERLLARRPQ